MSSSMPAPDPSERLPFPSPQQSLSDSHCVDEPAPDSRPMTTATTPPNRDLAPKKMTASNTGKQTIDFLALFLGISAFFLNSLPFLGILIACTGLLLGIRGLLNNSGRRKFFLWAIVLSALGFLASVSNTVNFVRQVAGI